MVFRKSEGPATCGVSQDCPISAACGPVVLAPCNDINSVHAAKLALCNTLEAIADSLPWHIDRFECLRVGAELAPTMRRGHLYEETNIFPAFQARGPEQARSIARLKEEHIADECAAAELSEILLRVGHGGEVDNPEAMGFMLRALFQGIRRHVAFEREHILPMAVAEAAPLP